MSSVETIRNELTTIIGKANAKTGSADETVRGAVDRLVDGYNPDGIIPSGTKTITSNGTHDVTSYASASVNVPTGGADNCAIREVTLPTYGNSSSASINEVLAGDEFVKAHYTEDNFSVTLVPMWQVTSQTGAIVGCYHGNRVMSTYSSAWTGFGHYWSSETVVAGYNIATAVKDKTYQAAFRADNMGALSMYLPAARYLLAGPYRIVMTC